LSDLTHILSQYWGYDTFRPLQREAMDCVMQGRDSVVVLPTGGGKSLCYQVPAVAMDGMAVVVSPLISLMKDQVDALSEVGVGAAFLNSSQTMPERQQVTAQLRAGRIKLLYVAPERLVLDGFLTFLKQSRISFFAIDEAHCISIWGHDFRPEYRALKVLKEQFPGVAVHAYTATATPQVREDMATQLALDTPEMLVGSFDRPNLIYSVRPKDEQLAQIREILDRHKGESGIIYCIRRAEVDALSLLLKADGLPALSYHAGLSDEERRRNQEVFIREDDAIIVSTVAFGMGIDKPDVRFVIHWGMPKSLEHYQQESGRAGRDGLDAECCLFFSGGDLMVWKRMLPLSDPDAGPAMRRKLEAMYGYCTGLGCRHRTLVRYFGQDLPGDSCSACDLCLDEADLLPEAQVVAQKILSSVIRTGETFGITYNIRVLNGSRDKRVLENGHERLSTYGILGDVNRIALRQWIEQLTAQGYLELFGDYHVLKVTAQGRRILSGAETSRLLKPVGRSAKIKGTTAKEGTWEGVDRGLFQKLRQLRSELAEEKRVPAYVVFDDAALRDMARRKPLSRQEFLLVRGVGEKKAQQYALRFVEAIQGYVQEQTAGAPVQRR
jgi:ATP-dependent DNA helicase RecQ